MTRVINFYGGPGVGKSTTASGIFHELKKRDLAAEYVSEYAKDITWEGLNKLLENQIHVFSEQLRRQYRLLNKVDWIVTDSPLLLSGIYYRYYYDSVGAMLFTREHMEQTVKFFDATFHQFDNVNFVIRRSKKYQAVGRMQTESEAKVIDGLVSSKLIDEDINFTEINYENAIEQVLHTLKIV